MSSSKIVLFKAINFPVSNCIYFSYPHRESQSVLNEIFFQFRIFSKILAMRTIYV